MNHLCPEAPVPEVRQDIEDESLHSIGDGGLEDYDLHEEDPFGFAGLGFDDDRRNDGQRQQEQPNPAIAPLAKAEAPRMP